MLGEIALAAFDGFEFGDGEEEETALVGVDEFDWFGHCRLDWTLFDCGDLGFGGNDGQIGRESCRERVL